MQLQQPLARRGRRAFTLVQMLVVIAIIGVLVALLLPAVQGAREAARRVKGQDNLQQIGLAALQFEDTYKKLPPGAVWDGGGTEKGSVYVYLLPYLERASLYQEYDLTKTSIDDSRFPDTKQQIASTVIPTLICPS